ncbi:MULTISPECIES: AAA family ATPase [unclassified Streptomyces]|uniref:AAA family ATPase n=1 Tax=unclassified Streptomyces TaxID=2593676 RepID=UPI002E1EC572|nr:ATP-binding protein [Streptomyces sp. NBC_01023]
MPPTNVHALIGSNGVGKTHLLDTLARTVLADRSYPSQDSRLTDRLGHQPYPFANLVSVGFSAFDALEPLAPTSYVGYQYVGLKKRGQSALKGPSELGDEFADSASACTSQGPVRERRWREVLKRLEDTDQIFQDHQVALLADPDGDGPDAKNLFAPLSSGHKIVLLTLARLVEHTTERTLVLVDEPEAHLHPPLLSTFIRVLSELLLNSNGVALIATHSPVVLQETPRRAVWALRRAGADVQIDHPDIETFGENAGVITREIFSLEVTRTGFHAMIEELAWKGYDYDEILGEFEDALGAEGRALARVAVRRHRDGTR